MQRKVKTAQKNSTPYNSNRAAPCPVTIAGICGHDAGITGHDQRNTHVQKALNRGEAYHRFRRAVSFINGGKSKVQTETEQQVWNDCARLIANAGVVQKVMFLGNTEM